MPTETTALIGMISPILNSSHPIFFLLHFLHLCWTYLLRKLLKVTLSFTSLFHILDISLNPSFVTINKVLLLYYRTNKRLFLLGQFFLYNYYTLLPSLNDLTVRIHPLSPTLDHMVVSSTRLDLLSSRSLYPVFLLVFLSYDHPPAHVS